MIKFVIRQGVMETVEGDTQALYGLPADMLEGLPYSVFSSEPLSLGLSVQVVKNYRGVLMPAHFYVKDIDDSTQEVIADALFTGEQHAIQLSYIRTIFHSLAFSAEYGDPSLADHLYRIDQYALFFGREYFHYSPADQERFAIACLTHDVGNSSIPREILYRPDILLDDERRFLWMHTKKGRTILEQVEHDMQGYVPWMHDETVFAWAKDIALSHHEQWDGTGYPEQKRQEDIPVHARVLKVMDVMDALMSNRPYKSAWTWDQTKEELHGKSGVEFDPQLIQWLLHHETLFLREKHRIEQGGGLRG